MEHIGNDAANAPHVTTAQQTAITAALSRFSEAQTDDTFASNTEKLATAQVLARLKFLHGYVRGAVTDGALALAPMDVTSKAVEHLVALVTHAGHICDEGKPGMMSMEPLGSELAWRWFDVGFSAGLIAMRVVTCPGIDPRIVDEHTVDTAVRLLKKQLQGMLFPAVDASRRLPVSLAKRRAGASCEATNLDDEQDIEQSGKKTKKSVRKSTGNKRARISAAAQGAVPSFVTKAVHKAVPEAAELLALFVPIIRLNAADDTLLLQLSALCLDVLVAQATVEQLRGIAGFALLKLAALDVLRELCRSHPKHRPVILEDMVSFMGKASTGVSGGGQGRYATFFIIGAPQMGTKGDNGSSGGGGIQMTSALLLMVIQAVAGVPQSLMDGSSSRSEAAAQANDGVTETYVQSSLSWEVSLTCAQMVVALLCRRGGQVKVDSNNKGYCHAMATLADDMLLALHEPEWPAAEIVLMLLCKNVSHMFLERDAKQQHQLDDTQLQNQGTGEKDCVPPGGASLSRRGSTAGHQSASSKKAAAVNTTFVSQGLLMLGKIVSRVMADVRYMREHPLILAPLDSDEPSTNTASSSRNSSSGPVDSGEVIACPCGHAAVGRGALSCTSCQRWYHASCLGMDDEHFEEELRGTAWECSDCGILRKVAAQRKRMATRISSAAGAASAASTDVAPGSKHTRAVTTASDDDDDGDEEDVDCQMEINQAGVGADVVDGSELTPNDDVLRQLHLNFLMSRLRQDAETSSAAYGFVASQWYSAFERQLKSTTGGDGSDEVTTAAIRQKMRILAKQWNECGNVVAWLKSNSGNTVYNYSVDLAVLSRPGTTFAVRQLASMRVGGLCTAKTSMSLLGTLVKILAKGQPALRSKAIKAMALVLEADPALMAEPHVMAVVQERVLDEAISVREATLDLLGRYIQVLPNIGGNYAEVLRHRLCDTGLSVRKRSVKIMQYMLLHTQISADERTRMCQAMVARLVDAREEQSIKDLIRSTLQDLWFAEQSTTLTTTATTITTSATTATTTETNANDTSLAAAASTPIRSMRAISLDGQQWTGTGERRRIMTPAAGAGMSAMEATKSHEARGKAFKERATSLVDMVASTDAHEWLVSMLTEMLRGKNLASDGGDDGGGNGGGEGRVIGDADGDGGASEDQGMQTPNAMRSSRRASTGGSLRGSGATGTGSRSATPGASKTARAKVVRMLQARSVCNDLVNALVELLIELEEGHAPLIRQQPGGTGSGSGDALSPSKQLLHLLETLHILCTAYPPLLRAHAHVLAPYLKEEDHFAPEDRVAVLHVATSMLAMVVPLLGSGGGVDLGFLERISRDLVQSVYKQPPLVMLPAVQCLGAVAQVSPRLASVAQGVLDKFFGFLVKFSQLHTFEGQSMRVLNSLQRALYASGLLCKFCDVDRDVNLVDSDGDDEDDGTTLDDGVVIGGRDEAVEVFKSPLLKDPPNGSTVSEQVFVIVEHYARYVSEADEDIRRKALQGLGFIFCRHDDFLLLPSVHALVVGALDDKRAGVRVLVLDLFNLLLDEEERITERNAENDTSAQLEEANNDDAASLTITRRGSSCSSTSRKTTPQLTRSERVIGQARDGNTGTVGGFVQRYVDDVLAALFDMSPTVRAACVVLIGTLLRRGLMNPLQCIEALVALEADRHDSVRETAHQQLLAVHDKHPDFLLTRAVQGIVRSFELQARGGISKACAVRRDDTTQHYVDEVKRNESHEASLAYVVKLEDGTGASSPLPSRLSDTTTSTSVATGTTGAGAAASGDEGGFCVFAGLYKTCITSLGAKLRGAFLNQLVRTLDLQDRAKLAASPVNMLAYVAHVLATLPFCSVDEPLLVIYHINRLISLRASALVESLEPIYRERKKKKQQVERFGEVKEDPVNASADANDDGVGRSTSGGTVSEQEPDESPSRINSQTCDSNDTSTTPVSNSNTVALSFRSAVWFSEQCRRMAALVFAVRVKQYLKDVYNLSDARCLSYNPNDPQSQARTSSSSSSAHQSTSTLLQELKPLVIQRESEVEIVLKKHSKASSTSSGRKITPNDNEITEVDMKMGEPYMRALSKLLRNDADDISLAPPVVGGTNKKRRRRAFAAAVTVAVDVDTSTGGAAVAAAATTLLTAVSGDKVHLLDDKDNNSKRARRLSAEPMSD